MWNVRLSLLLFLSSTGCYAELPKSTPQCSKDWGGWWDAFHCGMYKVHWAVASANMELTKQLLDDGWDVNQEDDRGWTPVIEAAFWGKQDIAVELVRRGADLYTRGYMGLNVVKVAKLKWCIMHSSVNTCPTSLYDYDRTIEVLFLGCEWTECVDGFVCKGRQCWPDKCYNKECPENAKCVVENRKPVCRCNPGFVANDPNVTKCVENSGESKTGMKTGNLILDPCPEGYYIFRSQCLYIDDKKKVTWTDAAKRCKRKNGVLGKIESPEEFSDYLNEFYPKMSFWIGANDRKKEGVWRWYSGELLIEAFPWGVNQGGKQQPNDGGKGEDCMTIKYFNDQLKTQYVDNKCSLKHFFVCTAPRNYVDDLPSLGNSVYNIVEGDSSNNDEAHQRENVNGDMEIESSSTINSLDSNFGEEYNNTDDVSQILSMTSFNETQMTNVNDNITYDNETDVNTEAITTLQDQEEGELDRDDNISGDISAVDEYDSMNVNSFSRSINQNDSIAIAAEYISNMDDTNHQRLK